MPETSFLSLQAHKRSFPLPTAQENGIFGYFWCLGKRKIWSCSQIFLILPTECIKSIKSLTLRTNPTDLQVKQNLQINKTSNSGWQKATKKLPKRGMLSCLHSRHQVPESHFSPSSSLSSFPPPAFLGLFLIPLHPPAAFFLRTKHWIVISAALLFREVQWWHRNLPQLSFLDLARVC